MKAEITVLVTLAVAVSCAPYKVATVRTSLGEDPEAEVIEAAPSSPSQYLISNQYKLAPYKPSTPDLLPVYHPVRPVAYPVPQVQGYPAYSVQSPEANRRTAFQHQGLEHQSAILRSNLENNFDGSFEYSFETENGIASQAVGQPRQLGPNEVGQTIYGSYSYTAPDGRPIATSYSADENGFVAQGDHLPVAPEVPELPPLIAKSVAYILSHPPLPENQQ